jgi:hypothetical protein
MRFTTDGSRPKEEREGTGAGKDLDEGGAQYKLGLFTEELYRIHNIPPENVSHLEEHRKHTRWKQ